MIGDCNSVCISTEVVEHPLWTTERRLGINHPFGSTQSSEEEREGCLLFQAAQFTEERKRPAKPVLI
jgi:hypothetical protein